MTRRVDPTQQGMLQGALSSLMGVAGMFGPIVFTQTFSYFIDDQRMSPLPGAPFLLAAGILMGALAVAWRVTHPRQSEVAASPAL
jgi:DHA1 family tetracycline resistance protein-like MFS transporter